MTGFKRMALIAPVLFLAACSGDDSPSGPSAPPPTTPFVPTVSGTWSASYLVQFRREHDGYNGSFNCTTQMTLTQEGANFRGFAVVGAPCSPGSFEVTGTLQPSGAVTMSTSGPRPGAGTCPPPPVIVYTGLMTSTQLSVRASAEVVCPGELEGPHRFDYILTGSHR